MKHILLLTFLVQAVYFQSLGQEKADCPTIKIIAPDGLIRPGDPINFSTAIMGKFEDKHLEYRWTVSAGTISAGQGSPAITVATTQEIAGGSVTATVEIKGLSAGCKNSASGIGNIDRPPPPLIGDPLDKYGKLPWLDERVRIQNGLTVELQNDPKAKGLLIFSITKDSERKSVLARQKKILGFLKQSKIPSSRILMWIIKGYDYRTVVWIIPEDAKLPNR